MTAPGGGAKPARRRRAWAGLAAAGLLVACGGPGDVRVIKLAHGLPATHPVHAAMEHLAIRVADGSRGAVRVDVHPAEQLGTEREAVELLQIGSLGMTKVSASVLEGFVPAYAALSVPYLYRDRAHREAVLGGDVGRDLLLAAERAGVRGLAYYDAGSRSFYTRDRPIHRPEDLRGLKIRTQESPMAIRMVRALGGSATPIAWGELYTSLQQGVVDGAENNPPSFHLSGHYEVCRYYSLDEHTATPDVLLVASALWRDLSHEERALLAAAAADSARLQQRLWADATRVALAAVAAAGVEIIHPDKALFARAVAEISESVARDPELARWLARIRAVR